MRTAMVEKTRNTIKVPLESLLYLQEVCRNQRCGDHLSERTIERITRDYENHYKDTWRTLEDDCLGGAYGDPKNSWEEGRWTDWSVEDMKALLDKKGLPYKDGEPETSIDLYF